MKRMLSSFIVITMVIGILSSCSGNSVSDSGKGNSRDMKEFSDHVAGVWVLLADNSTYDSISYITLNKDMTMTSGLYPNPGEITFEITELHSKNDGSFQAVLYHPATEATDTQQAMPEYRESVIFSSDNAFRNSLFMEDANGQKWEYQYVSDNLANATKEFDRMMNHESSHSPSKNQSQNQKQSNEKTAVYTYTHAALEGAVIVKSDSKTGEVNYKKKCEKCGKVDSSTIITYVKSGTMNSSFYCSDCKSTQKVRIHCESDVRWE